MHLARVIGSVVATVKSPGLEGIKLLIVQPLTRTLEPMGRPGVAADAVAAAGPGDLVQIVASREAAVALPQPFVPVDLAILGIVDHVEALAGSTEPAAQPSKGPRASAAPAAPAPAPARAARGARPSRTRKPR